jgi:hypothetical protein
MARIVIFDKLKPGTQTWYEDMLDGAIRVVMPGDADYYVIAGMAHLEGVEDGTDGKAERIQRELKIVLAKYGLLDVDPFKQTLEQMIQSIQTVKAEEVAAAASYVPDPIPVETAPPIEEPVADAPEAPAAPAEG